MIKAIKKWFNKQNNITKKTAGIKEKEEGTRRKYEAAMSILEKRKMDIPVNIDRRKKNEYDLDLNHA